MKHGGAIDQALEAASEDGHAGVAIARAAQETA